MALRKGLPTQLAENDARDTRYDFKNLVVANADGSPRGGVTTPVGTSLVTASATMNVSVAPFAGIAVRDGGVVLLSNDGATNVLLAAAPGANSRLDVIAARQNDSSSMVSVPDANDNAGFVVIQGTASASPVKPTVPAGSLELATILIPSTATATNSAGVVITQTAPYTVAPGGSVPFRTLADLRLWTTAAPLQQATVIADTGNNGAYFLSGSTWLAESAGVRFKGSYLAGTLITASAVMKFSTIVEDTASGWNASTGVYTVPAGCGGTYLMNLATKQGTVAAAFAVSVKKNGANILYSPNAQSIQYSGFFMSHYETLAAGDTIQVVNTSVQWGTQGDSPAHNNYFELVKL